MCIPWCNCEHSVSKRLAVRVSTCVQQVVATVKHHLLTCARASGYNSSMRRPTASSASLEPCAWARLSCSRWIAALTSGTGATLSPGTSSNSCRNLWHSSRGSSEARCQLVMTLAWVHRQPDTCNMTECSPFFRGKKAVKAWVDAGTYSSSSKHCLTC